MAGLYWFSKITGRMFSEKKQRCLEDALLLGPALAHGPHRELTRSDRIGRAMRGKSVANGG